jgi:hypothetical protein
MKKERRKQKKTFVYTRASRGKENRSKRRRKQTDSHATRRTRAGKRESERRSKRMRRQKQRKNDGRFMLRNVQAERGV